MRKALPAFALGLLALELLSATGAAQIVPRPFLGLPLSLKSVRVPQPIGVEEFVKDKATAVALGKALFWDMQVGSDGTAACATCHFQAGVDSRPVNQLNPGGNGQLEISGPNHRMLASEYPFHKLVDPDNRSSALIRDHDDITGSQGVHASLFNDVVLGGRRDAMDASAQDPLRFNVGGLNVRRVTGRNTPSSINAVFNVRNFWDGRASRRFNGRNPFGDADVNARVLMVNDLGELQAVHISLDMASTASQAVGPPLSGVEMSAEGRTFMKLGKKILSLQPLATQEVKADDSVLGPLAIAGGKGLTSNYADMIRAAFHDKWWNSNRVVDGAMNVIPGATVPTDGSTLPTDRFTLMESNFSLFWGLAIAAYEATQVSDEAPFDQFREGNSAAMTAQQKFGMRVFMGLDGGTCSDCHAGPEFTGAAVSARLDPLTKDGVLERMVMANGHTAVYDGGYYNLGVRKTTDDIGIGANDPFGNPLSLARQQVLHPGSVQDNELVIPIGADEHLAANGAFKTPSLRNVELTGPYFHNGGEASLFDVVQFYARGGNFHDENIDDLHPNMVRMRGLIGHPGRQVALVDFLRSLTDERVRWYRAPFDHPELTIANGAQGNEVSVLQNLLVPSQGADALMRLPATGRGGATTPLKSYLNVPVFSASSFPAPDPTASSLTLFASDSMTVATRMSTDGDLWSNGGIRIDSRLPHDHFGDIIAGDCINVTGDSLRLSGNIMARGNLRVTAQMLMDGVTGGNVEYYAPMVMPTLPALPVLPLIQSIVNVPCYGTARLGPGRYDKIVVGTGGWVILDPGVYVVKRITLGIGAYLQYDPSGVAAPPVDASQDMNLGPLETVTIHVDDIDIARAAIISSGSSGLSSHLKMYVRTRNSLIRLNPDSFLYGSVIAPTAQFVMLNGSTLKGSVYARTISVSETAAFGSHSLVKPIGITSPGFANGTAGPVNATNGPASTAGQGLAFALAQNAPNPVRPSTTFRFALPSEREVDLQVFDVAGRAVRTLAKGSMSPGVHTVQWNATNDQGTRLSSGVYFYRLVAGRDRAERKMVIID